MDADVTSLVLVVMPLVSLGLDRLGRKDSWSHARWPWLALGLGKILGVRIVAPIDADSLAFVETIVWFALGAALLDVAVRWLWRRYGREPAVRPEADAV